ncbi:hypothetical protein N7470_001655 [Penicillium chermesinum]|nr:hypothetical protein N7470_001655 [Penicillium chermesinum]
MASTSNDRPVSANVTAAQSPPSDNDGGERPVRQQLQETTIESTSQPANESSGGRKRSFEESRENDDSPADKGESRKKRSRENTPDNSNAGEAAAQAQMSKKRSRENTPDDTNIEKTATQVTTADTQTVKKRSLGEYQADSPKASELTDTTTKTPEPEKKRHRDNSQEPETKTDKVCRSSLAKLCETLTDSCHQVFAASAFGKAAGASPFASLGKKLEPTNADSEKKTSASTFASSSLAGFAGSEKSPFSTLGASTPSIFKPAASSGFGSLGSGFSGVGGGFSGAAKSGGLTSFASNSPRTRLPTRVRVPMTLNRRRRALSRRRRPMTVSTSKKEEELTSFSCKAKLFKFLDGEWRERGIGTFKVNCRYDHGRLVGRMIMRADGALRVMLNSPVFKGMKYGDSEGKPPKSKQLFLGSMEEGRLVSCLLRTGKQETAEELYKVLGDLLESEREGGEGSEEEEEGEEEEKAEK